MFLDDFFLSGPVPSNAVIGEYNTLVVCVSYVVAVFGSYVAIILTERVHQASVAFWKHLYHFGATIALATGIWSMHFTGMLAYHTDIYVRYDFLQTFLSALIAATLSYCVIWFATQKKLTWAQIFGAAVLLGLAVCGMHYTGMAAMEMGADLKYIPFLFLVSVAIAIGASGAAVWMIARLISAQGMYKKGLRFVVACTMGLAVCGMHYTGMWASVFIPYADCKYDLNQSHDVLVLSILGVSFVVAWFCFLLTLLGEKNINERETKLSRMVLLGFVAVLFITTLSVWALGHFFIGKTLLKNYEENRKATARGVLEEIKHDLIGVEAVTVSNASAAANDPGSHKDIMGIIPASILNAPMGDIMAGGGIWPEPYVVDKKKERNSLFWGKDEKGNLKFYDDYNDPKGNGYHHEEWYVPLRYAPDNTCYWSVSYVDPYSHQPMVTCSVAIKVSGKFWGVSTVDLKLERINYILQLGLKQQGGYAMLFDRNNRFIAAPDMESVRLDASNFMTVSDYATKNKWFSPVANQLDKIDQAWLSNVVEFPSAVKLAKNIDDDSYQINQLDSYGVVSYLQELMNTHISSASLRPVQKLLNQSIYVDNDSILKSAGDAYIQIDPDTHWKLVVVTPRSVMIKEVRDSVLPIAIVMILISSVLLTVFFLYIRFLVIIPVNDISSKLRDQVENGILPKNLLNEKYKAEFGTIAALFNKRTYDMDEAVKRAAAASQAKSEFLANMSHELRTPLNSIIGMSQLINKKELTGENRSMLDLITKASASLLQIVSDILDFSKIEAGEVVLEKIPFDIHEATRDTVQSLKPMASEKGLSLDFDVPGGPLTVMGDMFRYVRVLTNLISNAVRYTENGSVHVALKTVSDGAHVWVRCEVKDTGIGISLDNQKKVFEKFVQADTSTTRKYGGTGLGLAITKELIELMGGEIGLISDVGKGSTFWFEISLDFASLDSFKIESMVTTNESTSSKINGTEERLTAADVRILVAEDHLMNQMFVKQLFKNLGVTHYKIAENGKLALEELQRNSYDIILMDCHMPEMDGYETTQAIRALSDPVKRDIPIIAMTANALREDEEKCLSIGMNAYISKPVIVDIFKEKLSRWVIFDQG